MKICPLEFVIFVYTEEAGSQNIRRRSVCLSAMNLPRKYPENLSVRILDNLWLRKVLDRQKKVGILFETLINIYIKVSANIATNNTDILAWKYSYLNIMVASWSEAHSM